MANEKRLIDANALLDKLERLVDLCNPRGYVFSAYGIAEEIGNAPTVDAVEVVHGRWIGETGGYMWRQNCSVCNGPVYNKMNPYYNYCPYCGAKMDGGNEDG